MARLFLNYRRIGADAWADRLHERLASAFEVFLDVDGQMPPAVDFIDFLDAQVASCEALVAVVHPGWLDEIRRRESEGEPDFVRVEIERALARGIPVAPVLVGGASMPAAAALPESLKPFARRNAIAIGRGPEFEPAVKRLIDGLEAALRLHRGEPVAPPAPKPAFAPLSVFRDRLKSGGEGPEMVVIPAGRFLMGSPEGEPGREPVNKGSEGPQHEVRVPAFALGKLAVTRGAFAAFVAATQHTTEGGAYGWTGSEWKLDPKRSWRDPGFAQADDHPVVAVNWTDAQAYCAWLSAETGAAYRLPSEAEWEYACRAGTTTPYSWGASITPSQANYGFNAKATFSATAFAPNAFGLHQMHGNVWEWCQDCWHESYTGAPTDGSAWMALRGGDCSKAVVRGGSWSSSPRFLRSANRGRDSRGGRSDLTGFRMARTLTFSL